MQAMIGSVRCPLLIGRDDFLELADRRLGEVAAGRGHTLVVAGEAGIGKTRFLEAVDRRARDLGFITAWGAVAPQDIDVPAASILDLARTMVHTPGFGELGGALLVLQDEPDVADLTRRRQTVTGVVDRVITAIAGPTLLGFEDLQWTDEVSLEIIAELARRSRELPLMLAAGYRTDEAPIGTGLRDWRSRMLTQRLAEEIKLRPLDEAETALATTLVLDTGLPAPRDVAEAVYARTDGIPLHIEELLGALSADSLANGYAIREATVPDTIEDAVIARLSHRSPEAQAVARAGAVIGRCFVPEVLAGIMDVPTESIDDPIQELIDNAILWPPGERGLFDFRHQLLRDAIYRSVPASERRRFHARAAEFGTQLEGHSEIHSSVHFERAGLRRQAYEAALAGARRASGLAARRESFELFQRAVANMPDDVPTAERAQVLYDAADAAATIEEDEIARDQLNAAVAAFRAAGMPVNAIDAEMFILALARRTAAPPLAWLEPFADLAAELDTLPPSPEADRVRADLAYYRGVALIDARRLDEARHWLEEAVRLGDRGGTDEFAELMTWKAGVIDIIEGDVSGGLAGMTSVAMEAERAGREGVGVTAYRDAGFMAMLAMDYTTAARLVMTGRRYADSIEQSHCAHVMAATSAVIDWTGGRWSEADAEAGHAIADHGCARGREIARWAVGYVALGRGETTTAEATFQQGVEFGAWTETLEMWLPPLWGLAEVALQAGDAARASALCAEAYARASVVGERLLLVPFVVTGARAALADHRPSDAAAWVRACAEYLAPVDAVAGPALDHARGLVAMADGATGVARGLLESAVAGWDVKGRIWEATWARLDLAACLIRAGRFGEAVTIASEARAEAARLTSRPMVDRADAVLRTARGRVPVDEPWRPLTIREFEVARLIGEGRTNVEIAEELGIAPKTASSHVEHILAKLGASRRAEIATWASHVERVPLPH